MDKNLLGYKGVKPVFAIVGFLTLVQSISIILLAKWLAEAVSALFAGEALKEQWGTALLFLLAFLVRHACGTLMSKVAYRFAETTGSNLRREMMDKLFALGPRGVADKGTGNLVTLSLEGVTKFRNYLELIIPRMVGMGITPWLLLLYIFTLDVRSGVILTVTMPIIVVFMILIGTTAQKHMDRQLASYRTLANHFVDSLRGLETLKFLGRSKDHIESIANVSDRYRSATMKTLRVAFLSSFALDFFTMLSVASVAVSLGLRLVNSEMTLVTALTILILAPEYFLPVRLVGADFHATLDGKEAGAAMKELIDRKTDTVAVLGEEPAAGAAGERTSVHAAAGQEPEPPATADGSDPGASAGPAAAKRRPFGGKAAGRPAPAAGSALPAGFRWNEASRLELRGIGVTHEADGPASLAGIDLAFEGMGTVGIIGESGAGKSTLIDVLGGFLHPSRGEAVLDGRRLSGLTDDAWRSQVSYIPQRPYLFSGTLAENVAFYEPDAAREAVAEALAGAGLAPLAASLPGGLDEPIGGGGRALSGGQAQRVALARALLNPRPILLLDEPTAHLDIETEYELKETLLPLFKGKRVFLATHRLHWMKDMDVIVVMDGGTVAESGSHEELLARKGAYYRMIQSQREGGRVQ